MMLDEAYFFFLEREREPYSARLSYPGALAYLLKKDIKLKNLGLILTPNCSVTAVEENVFKTLPTAPLPFGESFGLAI